jgi:MerR family copper efflux transcriptional regulator
MPISAAKYSHPGKRTQNLQESEKTISTAEHSHSGKRTQHVPLALDSVVWYGVYTFPKGATTAMEIFSIGQVARLSGVGVETVRFYEREGLLEEPARRSSGYRQYAEEVVKQIYFIKRAQQLGFSLKEIRELLTLRVDAETSCEQVKERAATKLAEVEQKIVELQQMRQALLQVASLCAGEGPKSRCPMLDALDHHSETVET